MGQDADAVMIAGNGGLFVGPTGTTLPTDIETALDPALLDTGYVNEDGATFRDEKTKEPIPVWQSFYPVKHRVTDSNAEIELILKQFDAVTVPLAFGGGAIVEDAGPPVFYTYTPPNPEQIDERAAVLQWLYDTFTFRLVVPRFTVQGQVETQLARIQESELPLTLGVLGTPGAAPWSLITDHPAFAAA